MQNDRLSELERLKLRRKRRRERRIKLFIRNTILFILITAVILLGIFLISYFTDNGITKQNSKGSENSQKIDLKSIEIPQYVDVQLINRGLARKGKKIKEVNDIVIHYTGNPNTTAQNNRDYFNKIDTTVCSHFVVGLQGEVIQCVPLNERSAASNWRNSDTISIEVCHPDETGKFNEETYNTLVTFTSYLCEKLGLDEKNIIRHYDITGKECPRYYVENEDAWNTFLQDVKGELS